MKPELFAHEDLFEAERETGLPLRIAFVGLFTCADREGRFKWRPRTLKLAVLPHDDLDFSRVLDAFVTRGFLVKYACESGEEIGLIPTFTKHQVINNREMPSDLPAPPADLDLTGLSTRTPTRESRVDHASTTRAQGKGKERKGKTRDERVTREPASSPRGASISPMGSPEFDRFWAVWPSTDRKVAKAKCLERWRKVKLDDIADCIVAHVNAMKATKQWREGYEPAPLTYLNQRRWEDELPLEGGAADSQAFDPWEPVP
ncbi:hypothetical protein [Burkholderia cenocepacia]|uniref:hypothetical protein n=1 Tax=Burkholderia cenocepacia TaxID=95486 RepID=UPI00192CD2BA|nr:hypothetical protein [Burkholderia cenocepacia]